MSLLDIQHYPHCMFIELSGSYILYDHIVNQSSLFIRDNRCHLKIQIDPVRLCQSIGLVFHLLA